MEVHSGKVPRVLLNVTCGVPAPGKRCLATNTRHLHSNELSNRNCHILSMAQHRTVATSEASGIQEKQRQAIDDSDDNAVASKSWLQSKVFP
jgi:hypothetical protein